MEKWRKNMDNFESKLLNLQQKYAELVIENWLSSGVFTWSWWSLVLLSLISWLIFYKYFDKERALQIWCFGLTVVIITSFIDDLGSELGIWIYPIKFVPVGLIAYPFDFSVIPVAFMLIFQYCNSWKSYTTAIVIVAFIFAFIGEPFSVWLGTVKYIKWKYIYSFGFYIITGLLAKFFITKVSPK
jgi:hypothetical protein